MQTPASDPVGEMKRDAAGTPGGAVPPAKVGTAMARITAKVMGATLSKPGILDGCSAGGRRKVCW